MTDASTTTETLSEILLKIVRREASKKNGKIFNPKEMARQFFISWWGVASSFAMLALWIDYGLCDTDSNCVLGLAEGLLVLFSLVLLGLVHLLCVYRLREEKYVRLERALYALRASPIVRGKHWRNIRYHDSQFPSLVFVFRKHRADGKGEWLPMPTNLLVKGDVISIPGGKPAPLKSKCPYSDKVFERGDIILANTQEGYSAGPNGLVLLTCLETPLVAVIEDYLKDANNSFTDEVPKLMSFQRNCVIRYNKIILVVVMILGFALNGVRFAIEPDGYSGVHLLLARQAFLAICAVPLMIPIFEQILETWGTAKLLALSETFQGGNISTVVSPPPSASTVPNEGVGSALSTQLKLVVDREDRAVLKQIIGAQAKAEVSTLHLFELFFKLLLVRRDSAAGVTKQISSSEGIGFIDMTNLLKMPLKCCTLLETLSRTTALCCLDEQSVMSPFPSVEEIMLLKGETHATVLDVCDGPTSGTVAFENPNWQLHLNSLKPIALVCSLSSETPGIDGPLPTKGNDASFDSEQALNDLASFYSQRTKPWNLHSLSRAIGFRTEDLRYYLPCQVVRLLDKSPYPLPLPRSAISSSHHRGWNQMTCVIVEEDYKQSAGHRKRNQRHKQPKSKKEDHKHPEEVIVRPGSEYHPRKSRHIRNLSGPLPNLSTGKLAVGPVSPMALSPSTVGVAGKRSLHMFSWGDPGMIASCCAEYWGGESLWPLRPEDRDAIHSIDRRWATEEFDGVAFAYTPIPSQYAHLFTPKQDVNPRLVYLKKKVALEENSNPSGSKRQVRDTGESLVNVLQKIIPTQAFTGMIGSREQPRKSLPGLIEDLDVAGVRFVFFSPRNPRRSRVVADKMGLETDWNTAISLKELPNESATTTRVASEGDQKVNITIEQQEQHTDTEEGNRAIWDEKAKLPHGIKEIRKHIQTIDDVPLRVSTFTDSTPSTTKQMIEILQENGEIVTTVGTGQFWDNFQSFNQGNVSVTLEPKVILRDRQKAGVVHSGNDYDDEDEDGIIIGMNDEEVEDNFAEMVVPVDVVLESEVHRDDITGQVHDEKAQYSRRGIHGEVDSTRNLGTHVSDSATVSSQASQIDRSVILEALPALIQIKLSSTFTSLSCSLVIKSDASLSIIGDLIAEARLLTVNYRQGILFLLFGQLVLLGVCLLSFCLSLPDLLQNIHITWFLWIQIPALGVPMISTRMKTDVLMKQVPSKNDSDHISNMRTVSVRYLHHMALRVLPTSVVVVILYSLAIVDSSEDISTANIFWSEPINWSQYKREVEQSQLLTLFALAWYFDFHALTFVTRHHSIYVEPPLNLYLWIACLVVLILQIVYTEVYLYATGSQGPGTMNWLSSAPNSYWILFTLWIIFIILEAELLKYQDRQLHEKYQRRLRVLYETRLGMYSPK